MSLKNLKEACGVFACYNIKNAPFTTYYGLHALQHRGQDACGILWVGDDKKIRVKKNHGLLDEVFNDSNSKEIFGNSAIGHTRYATTGGFNLSNVQPFLFKHKTKIFGIAHNGNISNSYEIRDYLEEKGSIFVGDSDTELIGHALVRQKKLSLYDSLKKVLSKFKGGFSLVLIDQDGIYGVRDKWGFRPLVIGKKDNSYFIASETCALDIIGAKFVRDVKPGEVIKINENGITSSFYTTPSKKQKLCAMELIYFARPDSVIDGINVHKFRKETGIELAKLYSYKDVDMVIPVPESSVSATLGFSQESKIPYEMGLVKNRYIARTFIKATQIERFNSVKRKLNAVSSIVKDKNIILIDDSVVRGTTIKQIIAMLQEAGANKIHVLVASPKIIAPSYYGINISTYDELIAHHYKTEEEIAKFINADSINFLPLKTLKKLAAPIGVDDSIFTDKFPCRISPELIKQAKKTNTKKGIINE